ncbi:SusC/RagA family TonB-linked outer membrane protein [Sphingobacterium alkalisoli]|uniref:SusC/RagA family TonB-linked outer membrane protein n=1 Tax=Sphingobacterium alkalisoli TaxID=1874115 RepID=A0A4U0H976_9SPHI|nr:SusC/RagA family TonB-linked outer membrane protein [Sphingobacterium alkalisoli]TJY68443.1 SusC/RagA family TonB-linked outer membrane protein [Sphingobacterium alkalisoli]GGH06462.1 SusC/RagA family TonB-linked outer membrane protein [Sphingobacterium alkalisoli]
MNNILKQERFNETSACLQAILYMKLTLFLMCIGLLSASAGAYSQNKVSVNHRNTSLAHFLQDIEKKSKVRFVYSDDILTQNIQITVRAADADVSEVLKEALTGKGLEISKVNPNLYAIYKPDKRPSSAGTQEREVIGRVINAKGEGIPKVTFWFVGTRIGGATNEEGYFRIVFPENAKEIEFRYVGFVTKKIVLGDGNLGNVVLHSEDNTLEEVVVNTGLFERKAGTFTGSTVTFNQQQIKEVSNQNVLSALAILDPSFQMLANNELGSNPNAIPEIQLRGQTGFSEDLRTEYSNAANQPLFVVDGFESTIQRVFDLNINFIKSVTILKDGAAKAMWGAKAGNGVIVIETLRPQVGQMRISYNASANIQAPDLSSYHLTNSMQKVQAELLSGIYTGQSPDDQTRLNKAYGQNLKAVLDGVDTYWLSQPLQNGVGQRHTLVFDGGEENFQYSVNLGYNNNKGVMKGSDRNTYSGQSVLVYRKGKISATNNLSVDRNFAANSPYGAFSDYARMNPYWRIYDDNGNLIPAYYLFGTSELVGNPLYNGSLNSKDGSNYTSITQNFQLDYRHNNNLRFNARIGYNQQNTASEFFRSARHTQYLNISTTSDQYLNRGEYRISNGFQKGYTIDLSAAYNRIIGKHEFYFNGILTANEQVSELSGMTMVGFPNDDLNSIGMGREYAPGSKAIGTENTVRTAALTTALNYAYDNRYLVDLSFRKNGASQFGRNTKWGDFWSFGLGWNIHQEDMFKRLGWMNLMRITANTGITGTPPGNNAYQSLATYTYILDRTYNGDMGLDLMALANPDLKWQKVRDNNVRFELGLFNRLNGSFEYYIRNTNNLLLSMDIAPSLGFTNYAENIGDVRNKGFQATLNYGLIKNATKRFNINIFGNLAHNTNVINKISSSLQLLNDRNDAIYDGEPNTLQQRPVRRYEVGRSMDAIWAVKSLGIDPANGQEIFLKRDGSITYEWDAADQVVLGENRPQYNGTFGANVQYKDFSANFAFTYRWGGQMYNSTLVRVVDDADYAYNVDVRALEDRWKQPGDLVSFKGITNRFSTSTKPTSRFVQDLNEMIFSSISMSYNFSRLAWVQRTPIKTLMLSCNLNDLAHLSTVRVERGLEYPFARTMSFSLSASF